MKIHPVFVFVGFLFTNSMMAQEVAHDVYLPTDVYQNTSFFIHLDNDKFTTRLFDEDRDYTNGLALAYNSSGLNRSPFHRFNHFLLRKAWRIFHPHRDTIGQALQLLSGGLVLKSLAYTPENIAADQILFDDRPYASVQVVEVKTRMYDSQKDIAHSLGISYGVLATPMAEFIQRIVHTVGNIRPLPEGWHNQISHPWEPTLLVNYQRDRVWKNSQAMANQSILDLRETISIDLGYRIVGSYALTGRLGKQVGKAKASDLFLYMRLRPYALGYDVSLQGQFRPSVHTVMARDVNHFRAEGALGIGFKGKVGGKDLYAGYGFYAMTPEASYPNH